MRLTTLAGFVLGLGLVGGPTDRPLRRRHGAATHPFLGRGRRRSAQLKHLLDTREAKRETSLVLLITPEIVEKRVSAHEQIVGISVSNTSAGLAHRLQSD